MKKYTCIKTLCLEEYDEHGSVIENSYRIVNVGEIFKADDSPFRMVGGSDTIRLHNAEHWVEIMPETLVEHFVEMERTPNHDK